MTPLTATLQLGKIPRVVGTIITADFLRTWSAEPRPLPCDLVEFRLDGFPDFTAWLEVGRKVEGFDIPVFATIRLANEGGKWTGADQDRWPFLESALHHLSGADVEIESELADVTARLAADRQKLCVLSYHNFQSTPPQVQMRDLLKRAHGRGAIGKLAVTVNTTEDLRSLRDLLSEDWPLPVCLIGMGPLGRQTRLDFPRAGSCFTYGYLDTAGAPGQFSAAELTAHFKPAEPPADSGV